MSVDLKVFTFNLRVEADVDGINHFRNRRGRILDTISEYAPDLIGFQEVNNNMREWLVEALFALGYTVAGCGRYADYRGESTVIAYRRDRFEMSDMRTRWLSETPSVPASRFHADQSGCPRIFLAATLKHRDAAEPFIFLNTHLDHKGTLARLLGATQIMQYLSDEGLHFIITGDMNALPGTSEITAFTAAEPCGRPVTDATSGIAGTYHGFKERSAEQMSKIDYIFTDMKSDPADAILIPDNPVDGVFISDHRPVCATVTID